MEPRRNSALNENQQRRLIVTCQYVDRLLSDLERVVSSQSSTRSSDVGSNWRFSGVSALGNRTSVGPLDWLLDRSRSHSTAVRAISSDAIDYAERLLASNSSRVIFDLRERLSESRRALESELLDMLMEINASATRALAQARGRRRSGQLAVARHLQRLNQHRDALNQLRVEAAAHDDQQR